LYQLQSEFQFGHLMLIVIKIGQV